MSQHNPQQNTHQNAQQNFQQLLESSFAVTDGNGSNPDQIVNLQNLNTINTSLRTTNPSNSRVFSEDAPISQMSPPPVTPSSNQLPINRNPHHQQQQQQQQQLMNKNSNYHHQQNFSSFPVPANLNYSTQQVQPNPQMNRLPHFQPPSQNYPAHQMQSVPQMYPTTMGMTPQQQLRAKCLFDQFGNLVIPNQYHLYTGPPQQRQYSTPPSQSYLGAQNVQNQDPMRMPNRGYQAMPDMQIPRMNVVGSGLQQPSFTPQVRMQNAAPVPPPQERAVVEPTMFIHMQPPQLASQSARRPSSTKRKRSGTTAAPPPASKKSEEGAKPREATAASAEVAEGEPAALDTADQSLYQGLNEELRDNNSDYIAPHER